MTPAGGLGRGLSRRAVRAVRGRRLALLEARNKVLLGTSARALRRFEDREVARLAAAFPPLPAARVTTVIATYRRPEMLQRAVSSALAQSVREHVVIVMDDGGGLPELPTDPRLRMCSLSANTAVAGIVRNVGIRLAQSEYLAFLDDDNEWDPGHLEVTLAALSEGPSGRRPDLVYTALRRVLPDGESLDILSVPFDRSLLAREGYIDTNACVGRRCRHLRFSRIRRPPEVRPREDWELVWRMSRRHRVAHLPVPTVRYLVNPESYFSAWQEDGILPSSRPSVAEEGH